MIILLVSLRQCHGRPCHTDGRGLYGDQILPRAIGLALRGGEFARLRARVAAGLEGEVAEIGFGSGLNIPYYPARLKRAWAIDPAIVGRQLAAATAGTVLAVGFLECSRVRE